MYIGKTTRLLCVTSSKKVIVHTLFSVIDSDMKDKLEGIMTSSNTECISLKKFLRYNVLRLYDMTGLYHCTTLLLFDIDYYGTWTKNDKKMAIRAIKRSNKEDYICQFLPKEPSVIVKDGTMVSSLNNKTKLYVVQRKSETKDVRIDPLLKGVYFVIAIRSAFDMNSTDSIMYFDERIKKEKVILEDIPIEEQDLPSIIKITHPT